MTTHSGQTGTPGAPMTPARRRPPGPRRLPGRPLRPRVRARRLRRRPGGRSEGGPPTPWSARPSRPWSTWPTGGRPAARRTVATAPASSSRSPTTSTPTWSSFDLPGRGAYATGLAFLSRDDGEAAEARTAIGKLAGEEGLEVIGWRDVPIHDATLGSIAEAAMPSSTSCSWPRRRARPPPATTRSWPSTGWPSCSRKRAEHEIDQCYLASLSARTITYKGMLTVPPAGRVLPRPLRRAGHQRAGPRPLAFLDQHLPLVAAGPPLPLPGPQRRDQHRGREPQLDAGP